MIILGVDFGDARTGLSTCDKNGMMAVGAGCVTGGFKKALEGVCATAKKLGAELIVVGNPLNMNGTEGPRSERCRDFA
ncbi:MAG: Holliday junction resolvase RuvX, partial [Oscillospiraceae bacterium]|nr:Holliday junction resolvase RuvX [Oscillospiraceae bacterium]